MMAYDPRITDEDIRAAARRWLATPSWKRILERRVDDLLPAELRIEHEGLPASLMERDASDPENYTTKEQAPRLEAWYALEAAGYEGADPQVIGRTADIMVQMLREYVDRRMQQVFRPDELAMVTSVQPAAAPATPSPDKSPVISKHVDEWLAYIQNPTEEGEKPVPFLHAKQKGVTVRILIELIGDRPAASITRDDAKEFRRQLLRLPASHGKGRYVHAREAIAKAEGSGADLMKLKTVKRYFSALNGYWKWLRDRKLVSDAPSPFSGHTFPGTKSSKSSRDDWSVRDLERLLKSADYRSYAWDSADHWLPLIALHSGMRLEEIARLRVDHDVIFEGRVPCFKIQIHPDGWDPKTEAGAREIPVHSWLIKHGFLRLVEQRRKEGSYRLFSDLSNGGVTGTYGAEFSKRFSNLKIGLGIGKKTVFHSFRHTFRTEVDGEDIEDRFIDAVMGHEGKRSEGATYRKRVALKKRQQVIESFRSPLPLDFLEQERAPSRAVRVRKIRLEPRVSP